MYFHYTSIYTMAAQQESFQHNWSGVALTSRILILGKLQRFFHSFLMYSLSPTMTTCLSSEKWKLLARRGMTRLRRPIRGEWASAKRATTTWLLSTVMAACSRSCIHAHTHTTQDKHMLHIFHYIGYWNDVSTLALMWITCIESCRQNVGTDI